MIAKVWIQIRRAIRSWIGLGIACENPVPITLVSENKTYGQQKSNNPSILFSSRSKRVRIPFHGASTSFDSRRSLDSTPPIEIKSVLMRTQLSLVPGKEIRVTSNQWTELPTFGVHNQTNINPFLTIINPSTQNE